MDTNVLRCLLEVEASKSITLAAKHLYVSQPALTKQISKLEKDLGFKIFDRSRSPIMVTPEGEVVLDFARRYQELEQELHTDLALLAQAPQSEPVRVATTHRGGGYVGIHTAPFMQAHPNIGLEYLDYSSRDCEQALENETVDLAIYTDPVFSNQIEYMPLEEDPLVLVIPVGSSLLEGLDLTDNTLEHPVEIDPRRFRDPSVRYVFATAGQGLYAAEQSFCKRFHVNPHNPLRVEYVDTRYQVACSGSGVALLPHMTMRGKSAEHPNVVYGTPKGERLYRYVIVARKKGRRLSQNAETVWRYLVGLRYESHHILESSS